MSVYCTVPFQGIVSWEWGGLEKVLLDGNKVGSWSFLNFGVLFKFKILQRYTINGKCSFHILRGGKSGGKCLYSIMDLYLFAVINAVLFIFPSFLASKIIFRIKVRKKIILMDKVFYFSVWYCRVQQIKWFI
jgi:hypothetical protein